MAMATIDKKTKKVKEIADFHKACNALAALVNKQLFADPDDPEDTGRTFYWIGDEIGGVCDYDDCDCLNPTDMVLIVEHKMSYDEYAEWRNALLDRKDDEPIINLESWLRGARYEMFSKSAPEE